MKKTLLGVVLLAGLCPLFAQTIQNGVLDLRNKDFTREFRFLISGKMGFYNGQLRIPRDVYKIVRRVIMVSASKDTKKAEISVQSTQLKSTQDTTDSFNSFLGTLSRGIERQSDAVESTVSQIQQLTAVTNEN